MGMDTPKDYSTSNSIPSQIYTIYLMLLLWECTYMHGELREKQLVNSTKKSYPHGIAPFIITELCFSYWCTSPLLSHQFHLGTSSSLFQHVRTQFLFFLLLGL
jgi:hypothetical protein